MLNRDTMRGPWAGLPVSWTDDNRFDQDAYEACVTRCCQAGMPGVYTGGTTGEFYAMEFAEFQAVTRATAVAAKEHGTPFMIGCTSTYTLGAVRRAAFAAECGADAIQLALPYWMEIPEDQIVPFVQEVASAAPGLAISIYETRRAKRTLTLDQHRAIKEAVPAYIMVKANAGTLGGTTEGCRQLSELVNVFVGEHLWGQLGPAGAAGGCSSLVYWAPAYLLDLWAEVEAKNWEQVEAECARIQKFFDYIGEQFGSRGFSDTGIDRLGGNASGFLPVSLRSRGPYPSPNSADRELWQHWCRAHFPEMIDNAP